MAKKITMILVVIMLIVGFSIGLVASPFIVAQNSSSTTDTVWANIEKTGVIQSRHRPKLATIPRARC